MARARWRLPDGELGVDSAGPGVHGRPMAAGAGLCGGGEGIGEEEAIKWVQGVRERGRECHLCKYRDAYAAHGPKAFRYISSGLFSVEEEL